MITLNIKLTAGTSIEDAFLDSIRLATKLDVCIEFNFNDKICWAFPNSNPFKGVESYLEKGNKYASSK